MTTIEEDEAARSAGDGRPLVAAAASTLPRWLAPLGAAIAVALVFAMLNAQRMNNEARSARLVSGGASQDVIAAPPPPPDILATAAEGRGSVFAPASGAATAMAFTIPVATDAAAPVVVAAPRDAEAEGQRRKAPALVVDLAPGASATVAVGAAGAGSAAPARPTLNPDEQFAARIGGESAETARATSLYKPQTMVTQGTIIPAILETALNSDLPGFARAVVSRDVRGFDGATVLVPRGSRLIGQYRSGVALGQSRAFVIWSRILRPDGASIQIASPGGDQLGRAGLRGDVNRHFFERFSGAILLSVLNAAVSSVGDRPETQIVIGSSDDATTLASAAIAPTNISPTIKVPQGSPIRIFVARDLDFSTVAN